LSGAYVRLDSGAEPTCQLWPETFARLLLVLIAAFLEARVNPLDILIDHGEHPFERIFQPNRTMVHFVVHPS
jgi:hypothetical protein